MTTLGQHLAHYRKEKGFTQQQLSELVNVSPQAISKWENDQAEPDVSMLITLAELFGTSLNTLLKGEEDVKQEDIPPEKQESVAKETSVERIKKIFAAHKKPIITTACIVLSLAILISAFFIIASRTFLQPCTMYNYNRIDVGMKIETVEDMLGTPHKKSITKTVYGYSSEAGNAWMDEAIQREDSKMAASGTYYYYAGEYARILDKIAKLENKIRNADSNTGRSTLKKWEKKIAALEEALSETEPDGLLRVTFKNKKVTEVYIETDNEILFKPY